MVQIVTAKLLAGIKTVTDLRHVLQQSTLAPGELARVVARVTAIEFTQGEWEPLRQSIIDAQQRTFKTHGRPMSGVLARWLKIPHPNDRQRTQTA